MSIAIPNVVIQVNTSTSRTFYEPEYVVPLLRALWTGAVDDVYKDLVVSAPRNHYQKANAKRVVSGDFHEALAYEERRLRNLYGVNPRTGSLLFDLVYPGNTFAQAFRALLGDEASEGSVPSVGSATSTLEEFVTIGVPEDDAARLVAGGFHTVQQLAQSSVGDLLPLPNIGRVRAQRYIDAAITALHGYKPNSHEEGEEGEEVTPVPDVPDTSDFDED